MAEKLLHEYQYMCSKGHYQGSHKPLSQCVAARCKGVLKRVGEGSRSEK